MYFEEIKNCIWDKRANTHGNKNEKDNENRAKYVFIQMKHQL